MQLELTKALEGVCVCGDLADPNHHLPHPTTFTATMYVALIGIPTQYISGKMVLWAEWLEFEYL